MSDTVQNIIIRTGSDPRERPEFEAIREEINKINHPAQPEVNWNLIESLSLTLFCSHGVDLQTAVYYTLARTHKQKLAGFTEGCELLTAIVVNQWEQLWPTHPQARMEILEWFNGRVGSAIRQHSFERSDVQQLYRAERALQLLCDKLHQVELKRVPRIENLLYLVQNTVKRLESPPSLSSRTNPESSPKQTRVYLTVPGPEPEPEKPQPIPQPIPQPGVEVRFTTEPPAAKGFSALQGFLGGLLLSLLLAAVAYFAWIQPEQKRLNAVANRPEGDALLWLGQPELSTYGEQLQSLARLSPQAGLQTADALVATARQRWPDDRTQQSESQRWERLLVSRSAASGEDNSYVQIQRQLQALSDTLLEREKAHSGLTISYLKTVVYQMQNDLNRDVPIEERLRQYSEAVQNHQPVSAELAKQTEERLNALLSRYHQLTLLAGDTH